MRQLVCPQKQRTTATATTAAKRTATPTATKQATLLADADAPTVPNGLVDLRQKEDDDAPLIGTDKAATPAERLHSLQQLSRNLESARPLI